MKRRLSGIAMLLTMMLTGILTFTSCKKEDTAENPAEGLPKLEKVSLEDESIQFVYNTDGTLKQALVKDELATGGDEVMFTVSYNAQKKIKEVTTTDGRKLIPLYDNGEMYRVELRNHLNQLFGFTDYQYLNGRVKSVTLAFLNGNTVSPWLKFIFNYDAMGNVQKTNLFVSDFVNDRLVPAGYVTYEYDTKINPQAFVRDFLWIIWQPASANNVKKEVHVDQKNAMEETREYTFTYNSRNLPASAAVVKTVPGQPLQRLQLLFSYR